MSDPETKIEDPELQESDASAADRREPTPQEEGAEVRDDGNSPPSGTDPETTAAPDPEFSKETKGTEAPSPEPEPEEPYRDQLLRLRADFENFRKRTRREKEEWTQRCLENVFTDLLTVLDHFDLGLENAKGGEVSEEIHRGFEMIRGQLGSVLGKYGLESVEVEGGAFDPNLHEAITHLPSPEVPEGEVVAMTRKGYKLGDRLLRATQVVVSAGDPAGPESTETGEDS